MNRSKLCRIGLTGAILAAACGGTESGEPSATGAVPPAAPDVAAGAPTDGDGETDEAVDPDPDADTESTVSDSTSTESPADDSIDAPYPVEIEHVFGTTVIPEEPQRVVTVGYAEHDFVLAVGVQPVGVRANYDSQPVVVWPWAEHLVTGEMPELLNQTVLNLEAVAALQPDLIFAINLRLDEGEYDTLSAIAPTIARPVGTVEAEVPWRLRQEVIGLALDRVDEAAQAIADTDARFADVRAAHPEFAGLEAVLANAREDGGVNTFDLGDARYQFLLDLGFDPPVALLDRPDDELEVSLERLDELDGDVIIWSPTPPERLQNLPTREALLSAARERREIIIDPIVSIALVEASPLSLQYVIDRILTDLALAVDGDPDTVAASAVELYGLDVDGASAAEQAAMDAWVIVLGPEASLDEKRRHTEDFDELLPTVEAGLAAGEAAGGIEIIPTRATINGDSATVVFDVALGGSITATDFTADLTLIDGVWVASRSQVCTYVALIGVQCPGD